MKPPSEASNKNDKFKYLSGFGNQFQSEAVEGALPVGQNTPQQCAFNLYAEQLTGSAFTAPRPQNLRTWFYRLRPAVCHGPFKALDQASQALIEPKFQSEPNQLRWSPFPLPQPSEKRDWVQGLSAVLGSGHPSARSGLAIYVWTANESMNNKAFNNSDGDMLIVPQLGTLNIQTEMGWLSVAPNEIAVVPRGIRFSVQLAEGSTQSRGYVMEVYNSRFELPDLGPIGANGLANPRDFLSPVACFEDKECPFTIVNKYEGKMFSCSQDHSPYDVVAWHGNYVPFKYDLNRFNTINSTSFDHIDPSIFLVLTCKSAVPGTPIADFVIFPPRWAVQNWTFRPPYYHRNCASEFMGLIHGEYEAKKDGFLPGGASYHPMMTPHGPDAKTFQVASDTSKELVPERVADGTMAFMFESSLMLGVSDWALHRSNCLQADYASSAWGGIKKNFAK